MKKFWIISFIATSIISLYIGMALTKEPPMDHLYHQMVDKINTTHVIKFKSGFAIDEYNVNNEVTNQWQFKREGTYDAWSKYLHLKNVETFDQDSNNKESDEDTSLTYKPSGGTQVLLPTKELYFKNKMYFSLDRKSNQWIYKDRNAYTTIELLPFNSEILNRYAKHYKSENRGQFVVYFYSVDPNYLSRTFPNIIENEDYHFPYIFREGTIKLLVYPDTLLPRRIYAIYKIENLENHKTYVYHIDSYFSEDESYQGDEEPAIPQEILQLKNN